ncbi:MAG: response regulator [Cyanobacteria bacterium J06621_11]
MAFSDNDFILIVDDNPNNLAVLSTVLKQAGHAVRMAVDGESALEQLTRGLPSLILLDVMMPGIDGFETCRRLKENPETSEIPVIFMTAITDGETKVKGLSLGAVDYIAKPFFEAEVLARVHIHLKLQDLLKTLKSQNQQLTQEIEQRQSAEQQLQHLNADLEKRIETRNAQLQNTQLELIQQEKMASLGNLVAGVAHEVNNPIGFLSGSVRNAQTYVQELFEHLELYQEHHPQVAEPILEHAEDINLEFLMEDFPKLLASMEGANQRIKSISTSLRTFSRADMEHKVSADLHEGLDSTLLILKYRLKASENRPAIEVIKNYGDLPTIDCFPGQLNQVFMNILANATDIFDEAAEHSPYEQLVTSPQIITVTTGQVDANWIEIRIGDNGKGMTAEVKSHIFDHLFTTKGVGQGTGLGLSISQKIVTEVHGGQLKVESSEGQGTEFCIRLPLSAD